MENNEWLLEQLQKFAKTEPDFPDRCLFEAAQRMVVEQAKRIQQANDELDGRIWSPDKW
ncbi:hypothetical protein MOO44_04730 [Nicoliella spurrieriana]|uniref:Uncharacterized protein n=1 Tax=Nicoliella spurrieriana TaxID=2925830 RepID=A0A976X5X7_9LACO|nr:hypothetical protein [Nicoliella spurrieriana]UQS87463.1 hypothetical protein MOO44_04730 [Nicoliella spurrieriana]